MLRAGVMAALLAGLGACDGVPDSAPQERASREISVASQKLEAAAEASGALPVRGGRHPAGRYGRRYEGGADSFCLLPDDAHAGRYRFAAESRVGQDDYCRGSGQASPSREKLLLRFDERGGECLIVARYEGDAIVIPGALDARCALLCSGRGSFAGVRFPRIEYGDAASKQDADRSDFALCR